MGQRKKVKTPTVLQMEAAECGAASLGMIFAYYGLWVPLEKLRQECGVNRDGSKASCILKAARARGCDAKGWRCSADNLREMEFPVVIHWEFNHFVVLEGIRKEKAYLNDPAVGHRIIDWEDFRTSYTGVVLTIKPGEGFVRSGHRYSILKAVGEKLWADKWAAVFVMLIGLFCIVPGLASPVFSQIFLDDILTEKHPDWMFNLCVAMFISFIVQGILSWLRAWCLTRWQQKLTLADSSSFFWHVLQLPMHFFQQRFIGEIASRVSFNESIAGVLSDSVATVLLDIFIAVFYLCLLLQYNVTLTIIGVSFSLVDVGIFFYLRRRIIEMTMRVQQDSGKEYGVAMNGLQMIETIKANGNENDFFTKWAGYRAKVLNGTQKIQILSQTTTMLPLLLSGVNSALIMTVGGFSIMDGLMTAGIFTAFQSLMGSFQAPFGRILGLGSTLQTTEMQMQRLDDVRRYEVDSLNYPAIEPKPMGKSRLSGRLELRDISFGYSPLEPPLLEHFSMTIEPGRWTAVVGASGSGKSTLAKVVTGLYEEWSGEVRFDGMLRREIPREVIVNSLSSVDQDIFQLTGTVKDNLTLFDESIRRADIIAAARDACIHEDILQLDGSYEGRVSEGGNNFSGGQRQRMEIARALANQPSLLVLDEATSALDPITEQQILQNIRRRGCACLVVAHRLSTIRDCDEIIVLEHGKIVERGTHAEMILRDGPYHRLVEERQRGDDEHDR